MGSLVDMEEEARDDSMTSFESADKKICGKILECGSDDLFVGRMNNPEFRV